MDAPGPRRDAGHNASPVGVARMRPMLTHKLTPVRLLAGALSLLLIVAMFFVPYRVPVAPSVSQSYATGFNNHAALLLFLCGGLFFAIAIRPWAFPVPVQDRPLPKTLLYGSMLLSLCACIVWRLDRAGKGMGSESPYLIDRQIHMVAGAHLYRDLEFIYGPLLVYPGYWLQRLTSLSPLQAYMTQWTLEWVVGTAMLWYMVARVRLLTRHRMAVFLFLYACALTMLPTEGTHYTPMRVYCAGFLAVAAGEVVRHPMRASLRAAAFSVAIALGFAVSPEQGVALGLGLSAYSLLLAWKAPSRLTWRAAACVPLAGATAAVAAKAWGMLRSMNGFASGGYNFPLLPSAMNLFILSVYLFGIALVLAVVARKDWLSSAVPLGLCGLPMLTSAFGRCDLEHLTSAVPLYLAGWFCLARRSWWFRAALLLAVLMLFDVQSILGLASRVLGRATGQRPPEHATAAPPVAPEAVGRKITAAGRPYFAPFALPVGTDGLPRWGADSGFFFGIQNVLTTEDLRAKADEIEHRRAPYLLLPDLPQQPDLRFWSAEENIAEVARLEGSRWAPVVRRPLPDIAVVNQVVSRMYVPTDMREDGWRVWALRRP